MRNKLRNKHGLTAVLAGAAGLVAATVVGLAPGSVASAAPGGGGFDSLRGAGDGVNWALYGWAVDSDTPTSAVSVVITIDGALAKTVTANSLRDDVAARYPGVGAAHGFETTIPIPAGAGLHYVCAYAVDTDGSGATSGIGCKKAQSFGAPVIPTTPAPGTPAPSTPVPATPVPVPAPAGNLAAGVFGRLTGSLADRTWTVTGWMTDLDTPSSAVQVDVYVDGVFTKAGVADGASHLYSITMPMPAPGPHIVCVYGLNTDGSDNNTLVGCKTGTSR